MRPKWVIYFFSFVCLFVCLFFAPFDDVYIENCAIFSLVCSHYSLFWTFLSLHVLYQIFWSLRGVILRWWWTCFGTDVVEYMAITEGEGLGLHLNKIRWWSDTKGALLVHVQLTQSTHEMMIIIVIVVVGQKNQAWRDGFTILFKCDTSLAMWRGWCSGSSGLLEELGMWG